MTYDVNVNTLNKYAHLNLTSNKKSFVDKKSFVAR